MSSESVLEQGSPQNAPLLQYLQLKVGNHNLFLIPDFATKNKLCNSIILLIPDL